MHCLLQYVKEIASPSESTLIKLLVLDTINDIFVNYCSLRINKENN